MHQLKIGTIPLPKMYVCEDRKEASECRSRGVPYILRPIGMDDTAIIKAVLYRTLVKKFQGINWTQIFGYGMDHKINKLKVNVPEVFTEPMEGIVHEVVAEHRVNAGVDFGPDEPDNVMDYAVDRNGDGAYRTTGGGLAVDDKLEDVIMKFSYHPVSINDYVGDLGWHVNIEELQSLKLLPVFLDDIAKAIKTNIANTMWMDGYNKKLDAPIGHYNGSDQAPNLIVLDTSGSIPSGVAGTMISLIETLRHQCNADLIITSRRSEYWAANTELPNADDLAYLIGGCNECVQFYDILRKHILGKHWGNVIVFGDYDAPEDPRFESDAYSWLTSADLQSTRIDRIMCFHTRVHAVPGYGLWATAAAPKAEVVYNSDWVKSIW